MPDIIARLQRPLLAPLLAIVIIAACCGAIAGLTTIRYVSEDDRSHFREHASNLRDILLKEIEDYTEVFNNINALFLSDERVREIEWETFVRLHHLADHLPGIIGIGAAGTKNGPHFEKFKTDPKSTSGSDKQPMLRSFIPLIPSSSCFAAVTSQKIQEELAGLSNFSARVPLLSSKIACGEKESFYLILFRLPQREKLSEGPQAIKASQEWIFMAVDSQNFIQERDVIDNEGINLIIQDKDTLEIISWHEPQSEIDPKFHFEEDLLVFQKKWTLIWQSSKHPYDEKNIWGEFLISTISVFSSVLALELLIFLLLWRRKILRGRLYSNENKLHLLIRQAPAAIAMLDKNMRYIMASDRWASDYGLPKQNLTGLSYYDLFPEILKRQSWLDEHQRALKGEVIQNDQDFWIRENSRKEWIKYRIHPWMDENGEIGGIIMFTEVITSLKATEDALRESEQLFRLALEHASIGKALVYTDGRFMKVNDALCQMVGYTEQELMQTDFQSITHPEDLDKDLGHVKLMLEGQEESFQMEKRYFHKDGHIVWVLLSASILRDENGKPKHFISQMQDITESKKLEEMKDDFISIIGHELKTPVTSISLSLDLLKGILKDTKDRHTIRIIEAAQNNSLRLTSLINDIIDLRRISSGVMTYNIHSINLKHVLEKAVQENEPYGKRFQVTFKTQDLSDNIFIAADEFRIAQVLTNFLSNAAKFSPEGSNVDIYTENRDADRVRVYVKDTGPGISSELRHRIFQKFAQADSSISRKQEGTGLGLHIAKEMIEKMGGQIGFESAPESGTCFWFEFPRADDLDR